MKSIDVSTPSGLVHLTVAEHPGQCDEVHAEMFELGVSLVTGAHGTPIEELEGRRAAVTAAATATAVLTLHVEPMGDGVGLGETRLMCMGGISPETLSAALDQASAKLRGEVAGPKAEQS